MALATSVSVTLLRTLVGFMSISGICTAKVWQDCLLQHPFPMCYRPAKEVSCLQGGRRPFQPWASLLDLLSAAGRALMTGAWQPVGLLQLPESWRTMLSAKPQPLLRLKSLFPSQVN